MLSELNSRMNLKGGFSNRYLRLLGILLVASLQYRCAQEVAPQGGKIDETPPVVKEATPPNQSTHFSAKQIDIKFDEFIQNTGFAHTLTSPPMEPKPVFKVQGKHLVIVLKNQLRANTTYTINFGDDIKNVTEGKVLQNFTYVFSTGDYIDSQRVSGIVKLAETGLPAEDYVVSLYPGDTADGFLKMRPVYFSRTDKNGSFEIKNVKAAKYNVYALKDQNFNYEYDQPNENIAFMDSTLDLTDTLPKQIELVAFNEGFKRLKFQNVKSIEPGKLMVTYTAPVEKFKADANVFSGGYHAWFYPTKDTAIVWFSNYYDKKLELFLVANDTLLDTVRIDLKTIARDSLPLNKKYAIRTVNQSVARDGKPELGTVPNIQGLNASLKIELSRPLLELNDSKALQITEDSSGKVVNVPFKLEPERRQSLIFDFQRKEKTDYTVTIPDSSFRDIYGLWNPALHWKFRTTGKDSYGNIHLTLKVENTAIPYIVKLLDATNATVKEIFTIGNKEKKVDLPMQPEGAYHVVVIEDRNQNGVWDTGNFKLKRQPERVINIKDVYNLKGNWDLDIEVTF